MHVTRQSQLPRPVSWCPPPKELGLAAEPQPHHRGVLQMKEKMSCKWAGVSQPWGNRVTAVTMSSPQRESGPWQGGSGPTVSVLRDEDPQAWGTDSQGSCTVRRGCSPSTSYTDSAQVGESFTPHFRMVLPRL